MIENKETELLKEIQKNTEMGMKAISTILPMVYEDSLARQLTKQEIKYESLHSRAINQLLESHDVPNPRNGVKELMLTTGIHMNTMLDTSTSHIAELLIQGSNRGITDMWKAINHQPRENRHMEMAKELMDFEEKNIEMLKKYL